MKNWLKIGFLINKKLCSKKGKCNRFVVTFHLILQALKDITKRNLNWLYADNEVKSLFSPGPMVLFRGARKLSSYLIRAEVYPHEHKLGSCGCGKKRCQVCLIVTEMDSFNSTSTNKTYKINHLLNSSKKCLVYLLTCRVCLKLYVGQTVDEFRSRWSSYKSNDRKYLNRRPCFEEHIFEHFNVDGHSGLLEKVS